MLRSVRTLVVSIFIFSFSYTTAHADTVYGDFTIDGDLSDWGILEQLDLPPLASPDGDIFGVHVEDPEPSEEDYYLVALKTTPLSTGNTVVVWLNTDQNSSTGHMIWGWVGGAEYHVKIELGGSAALYMGDPADDIKVYEPIDYAWTESTLEEDGTLEIAIPESELGGPVEDINLLVNINDTVYMPDPFSNEYQYELIQAGYPAREANKRRIGIVYSESTANNFYDKKSYSQLFMAMQHQAMMAGIPFDILSEDDLTDIENIVDYSALLMPYFQNVKTSILTDVENTLYNASYRYGISMIASGNFLTNDENNLALNPAPYSRMEGILDLQVLGWKGPVVSALTADDITHPVMHNYQPDEVLAEYHEIWFGYFGSVKGQAVELATYNVGLSRYPAVLVTETGAPNVHFGNDQALGDVNLVWQALQWLVFADDVAVGLKMGRNKNLFSSRCDMDYSAEYDEIPLIIEPLYNSISSWKDNYNFVGSYHINIGNNPPDQQTDWSFSGPWYQSYMALGNEIGNHSYTHPDYLLAPEVEFEFNQSNAIIETELGIDVICGAVPGNPETYDVDIELAKYMNCMSGSYANVGSGYPGAFGYMAPDIDMIYMSPNLPSDFTLIKFGLPGQLPMTAAEAEQYWKDEYQALHNHASQPIIHWPWHDYGLTEYEPDGYDEVMYEHLIELAYNDNAEFVTQEQLFSRMNAFMRAPVYVSEWNDVITAAVTEPDVGTFAFFVNSNDKVIQKVEDWYAYTDKAVFIPKGGAQFMIHLGTSQDMLSRITALPMRAELVSVTGNGANLDFSILGKGKVTVELNAPSGAQYNVTGGDSTTLNGTTLEIGFDNEGTHSASIAPVCGDGVILGNEQCDDGNTQIGDGCSATCFIELGWKCVGATSVCDPICGDSLVVGDEQCDDGNTVGGDGCSSACIAEVCGNGILDPQEQCDDGNTEPNDFCGPTCQLEMCGDNIKQTIEECDDGNLVAGDGCSSSCHLEVCGNKAVDPQEQCDDGNTISNDGCSATCMNEFCGDGVVQANEQCDDGNNDNNDGCDAACTAEYCGDGIVQSTEQCDDGNQDAGDGCSNSCSFEAGYDCAGSPTKCTQVDFCLDDPNKTEPGVCGCGIADIDANQNGIMDCLSAQDLSLELSKLRTELKKVKPINPRTKKKRRQIIKQAKKDSKTLLQGVLALLGNYNGPVAQGLNVADFQKQATPLKKRVKRALKTQRPKPKAKMKKALGFIDEVNLALS